MLTLLGTLWMNLSSGTWALITSLRYWYLRIHKFIYFENIFSQKPLVLCPEPGILRLEVTHPLEQTEGGHGDCADDQHHQNTARNISSKRMYYSVMRNVEYVTSFSAEHPRVFVGFPVRLHLQFPPLPRVWMKISWVAPLLTHDLS